MRHLSRKLCAAIAAFPIAVSAAPGDTAVVAVRMATGRAVEASNLRLSWDGRYAVFISKDAVTSRSNGQMQVYVRDRTTGSTRMVSVSPSGEPANSFCPYPADISYDGRFVLMECYASNLLGDGQVAGLVLRDRVANTTQRITPETFTKGALSGNGRYVAFLTMGSHVPGDTNNDQDMYLWDRQTLTYELISVDRAGQAATASTEVDVSDDGRYVLFDSFSPNIVPGDTNGRYDVFVRDRLNKVTRRASVSSNGTEANANNGEATMSGDGRVVVFISRANNLVPGDTGNPYANDVFAHDMQTGVTDLVNVNSTGVASRDAGTSLGDVSADGRFVTFHSGARQLVPNDTNGSVDVFVRDRVRRTTVRVNVDSNGEPAGYNTRSIGPAISGDGRFLGFQSNAQNWGTVFEADARYTVYAHELEPSPEVPVTLTPLTTRFGSVAVGDRSAVLQVTVKNITSQPVPITGVYLGGANPTQYQRTSRCPEQLAAGATCLVDVVFAPTSTGAKAARLFVNIGSGPVVKASSWLNGTGT